MHNKRRAYYDGRGSFHKIVRGINKSLQKELNIALRVNIDRENLFSMPDLADFIISESWIESDHFVSYFGPVREICLGYQNFTPTTTILAGIFDTYKKYPNTKIFSLLGWRGVDQIRNLVNKKQLSLPVFSYCGSNTGRFCLDLFGDIYTCVTALGKPELKIGSFGEKLILNKEKLSEWRTRDIMTIPECRECQFALFCGGGCSYLAILKNKNLFSPFCEEVKGVLEMAVKYFFPRIKEIAAMLEIDEKQKIIQ
ncbi:MAG: radical SAM protein [Promethearchaeota archaeon]